MNVQSLFSYRVRRSALVSSCLVATFLVGCSSSNTGSNKPVEGQKAPAPKAPTAQLAPTDKVIGSIDVLKIVPEADGKPKSLVAQGWTASADAGAPITVVVLLVNGKQVASTKPTDSRADVAEAFGRPDFALSGWKFELPTSSLGSGKHQKVTVMSTDSKGDRLVLPGATLTLD
jgi:hypothetical protein